MNNTTELGSREKGALQQQLRESLSGAVSIRIGSSWIRPCEPSGHGVAANDSAASPTCQLQGVPS